MKNPWSAPTEEEKIARKKYNKIYRSKIEGRYKIAIRSATQRKKSFELTFEEFKLLTTPNCFYCNGYFGKIVSGIGLDRLDNSKGYSIDNCVSCCKFCNRLRRDILTPEETLVAIYAIIALQKSKVTIQETIALQKEKLQKIKLENLNTDSDVL